MTPNNDNVDELNKETEMNEIFIEEELEKKKEEDSYFQDLIDRIIITTTSLACFDQISKKLEVKENHNELTKTINDMKTEISDLKKNYDEKINIINVFNGLFQLTLLSFSFFGMYKVISNFN